MNSVERHEIRYQRRKENRIKKKNKFLSALPNYDEIFSFNNLYESFKLCKNGVMWKSSMQSYEANLLINLSDLHKRLLKRTYKSKGFHEFTIHERGKIRHIRSVNIDERIVQRCLCDNYLIPLLRHNLIYDNGATLKGKGTDFTIIRLKKHICDYIRKNGIEGYILTFDFSDYFNSIQHKDLYNILDSLVNDSDILNLIHHLIDNFGENGLGLGSQISQICAVAYPNKLDHYIKDKLGSKYYGRYMDDGYIICKDKEELKKYKKVIYNICGKLNIKINDSKIKTFKLTKPFIFLKKKFFIGSDNKLVVSIIRKTITHERKKIKKYYKKLMNKTMTYRDIECAYKSWKGNIAKYHNYNTITNMNSIFNKLFIFNKEAYF